MRILLTLSSILLLSWFSTNAQKSKDSNIPSFGKVEKAELELKECEFDKNAEAMILFSRGALNCTYNLNGVYIDFENHVRIKILTDEGKNHADVRIPFYNGGDNEKVTNLEAVIHNMDASGNMTTTAIDKKSIYERKINSRFSEKVFSFPEVRPGSIIEYKFTLENTGLVNWYFQTNIPVKYSEFIVDFPNEIEVKSQAMCTRDYEKKSDETYARTKQFFAMKEVPALRSEPFILNNEEYLQKIETKTIAYNFDGKRRRLTVSWPLMVKVLMEADDFGVQLKKEIPRTADLDAELKLISSPYQKMKTIHRYVQKNMEWNGYIGIWASDGVKAAWKDKKGTTGEINLILVNLLKDAGLDAKPLLVSTHENGLVNTKDAGTVRSPGFLQFNKVMAYVDLDEKTYVLDATDKETPVHLIPSNVVLTDGLVIDKIATLDWGWEILWDNKLQSRNAILIQGSVDENGKMSGQANINSYDYARIARSRAAKKDRKNFTEKYFSTSNPGISIDSVVLNNLDDDSLPLIQNIYFNQQLNNSGEYKFFSGNLFTGFEVNPFVAENRISDVFFGYNQSYNIIGNFDIPDGYVFEELPPNTKMILPDTSIIISRVSQVNNNRLSFRISLEFRKPFYPVQDYPIFREFYKKLHAMLSEQYVFRKKTNP